MTSAVITHHRNGYPQRMRARTRVLILDRDPETLARLAHAVRSDPSLELVTVAPTSSGREARLPDNLPDVVLVDSALGAEAIRSCRGRLPSARYLVLSTGDDAAGLIEMLAEGAGGCLPKSAATPAVAEAIRELTDGGIRLGPDVGSWLFKQASALLRAEASPAGETQDERAAVVHDIVEQRRFAMVFQPIVDLATGAVVAVEALARFRTEERRSPDFWLGEADAMGLRNRLELELVREAVTHADHLPPALLMTVNLSPAAAASPELRDVLPERHLARLVVEITEHRQVDDYESLAEALTPLRAAGLRIAVDDSGEGLSSLQQVLQLGPEFIKLNRTLVRDLDSDPIRRALAFALTSVAGQAGASVVAEGIETAAELDALRSLGVANGQGYLIARPLPLDELSAEAFALPVADGCAGATISLPGSVPRTLHEASRAAFKLLREELPGSSFVVAQLDYRYRRFRIVAASDALLDKLEPGFSVPLSESLCYGMASGKGARLCNDVAADPLYGSLAFQRVADISSYVGVPLEVPGGPRIGSLCAISPDCDRYDKRSLELLQTIAPALVQALGADLLGHGNSDPADHMRALACRDSLTGALNRPSFIERLAGGQTSRERCHVLHLAIPSLDAVHQQYGRAVAELVLKDIADALAEVAEHGDVAGRIGDTAFASLLVSRPTPETARYTVSQIGERLRNVFARRGVVIKVEAGLTPLADHATDEALERAAAHATPLL